MKAKQPNDNPLEPRLDDNDALWRLLGESPRPEPDAWFTVRTLARCRHEGRSAIESWGISLGGMWRWALGSGLGLCLAVVLLMPQLHPTSVAPDQQKVQEAFEIMASLNSPDSDSSSSSSWQDSSY